MIVMMGGKIVDLSLLGKELLNEYFQGNIDIHDAYFPFRGATAEIKEDRV